MAVAALDQAFVDSMVIRLCEVGLRGYMTSVAEVGLGSNEKMFRFFGVMRRMAIQAPYIVARVSRRGEVPLLVFCPVAAQATGIGILLRHRLEANDLRNIPAAFYVRGSGTVTGLTTVPVVQRGLEMRSVLEVLFVELFMTGFASVDSGIFRCLLLGGSAALFLRGGMDGPKHAEQQDRHRCKSQRLYIFSVCLHGRTPRVATSAALTTAEPAQADSIWIKFNLLESLDPLRNRLGLIVTKPGDALVVWCLTPRLAFGYVIRDLICFEACSLQRRGLHRRLSFCAGAVAPRTLFLVKRRSIIRSPRSRRHNQ
jgi:hypothetical protein